MALFECLKHLVDIYFRKWPADCPLNTSQWHVWVPCCMFLFSASTTWLFKKGYWKPKSCCNLFLNNFSAKPKNSATAIPVQAGPSEVVVASCEAAQGKPEATISWITTVAGRYNHTSVPEVDGTVTVKSEYRMIPTPAENGKEITCLVTQRTQSEPKSFDLKLVVECKIHTQTLTLLEVDLRNENSVIICSQ